MYLISAKELIQTEHKKVKRLGELTVALNIFSKRTVELVSSGQGNQSLIPEWIDLQPNIKNLIICLSNKSVCTNGLKGLRTLSKKLRVDFAHINKLLTFFSTFAVLKNN